MRAPTCELSNKIFPVVVEKPSKIEIAFFIFVRDAAAAQSLKSQKMTHRANGPESVLYSFCQSESPIDAGTSPEFFDNRIRQENAVQQTAQQQDTSNYVYLAMTANHWGSGKTQAVALNRCRLQAGSDWVKKFGYVIYHIHPEFQVSDIDGAVMTPKGHPAIKIADKIVQRKKS